MAKGAIMARMTGKLGQMVGYTVRNSRNKVKQGWREYVAQVANPQTQAQAQRRMLMKPLLDFYAANRDILNHSFLPAGSAGANFNRFRSVNLSNPDGIPYVEKGDNRVVPGLYTISEGSLTAPIIDDVASTGVLTQLTLGSLTIGAATTFGELSQTIIDNNAGYVNGDELMFIVAHEADDGTFVYTHQYIVLDVDDTTALEAYTIAGTTYYGWSHVAFSVSGGTLLFNVLQSLAAVGVPKAAAVIHSRRTSGGWQYSTSRMAVAQSVANAFFTSTQYAIARKSYEKRTSTASSEKLLQQAGSDTASFVALVSLDWRDYVADSNYRVYADAIMGAQLSDGTIAVVYNAGTISGQPASIVIDTSGHNVEIRRATDGDNEDFIIAYLKAGTPVVQYNSSWGTL